MNKPEMDYKDESYFQPKECPICKGENIIRWGFRYNHTTKKRRYKCNCCNKLFVVDDGFFKCKKKREMITAGIDLYMNGMSLRKVAEHFNQFSDHKVSHMALLKWVRKYSMMVKPFTDNLPVSTSGTYHADEIFVRCEGYQNYFWDLIDHESRFLIATHYSTERSYESAKALFRKARARADKPNAVVTDGLQAYVNTASNAWFKNTLKKDEMVEHIRIIDRNDYRNNIIERVQGTIRERVKVMRGFHSKESAELILNLFVVWYNFLRVHQGIGMTPAQRAGIELNLGKQKWLNLIYRSKIK